MEINLRCWFSSYLLEHFEVLAACASMMSWAGLQKAGDLDSLRYGATLVRSNTINMMRVCAAIQNGTEADRG